MAKGNSSTATPPAEGDAPPEENKTKGSKRVKWLGRSVTSRLLADKDFKAAGLEGVGVQRWNKENGHIVDFSDVDNADKIIKFLTESDALKGEFRVLGEGEL